MEADYLGIGSQNAYIVKRKGVQFSRDPLNLVNLHSRKVSSLVPPTTALQKWKEEKEEMLTPIPARRLCQHQGMREHTTLLPTTTPRTQREEDEIGR